MPTEPTSALVDPASVKTEPDAVVWYCPSRWLLAHHDPRANINTMSSHMCLADLNNEDENLLALIDFERKFLGDQPDGGQAKENLMRLQPPFSCRLRVYRGQQLIYNHFLDDMPSSLLVTSTRSPQAPGKYPLSSALKGNHSRSNRSTLDYTAQVDPNRSLLTLTINDDVYFYNKLRPSHRFSLEDDECILESLDRSEVDVWQMVRQNKVDIATLHQLLTGVSDELGGATLSSHSNNFLSLATDEERKSYLAAWRIRRLGHGQGYRRHSGTFHPEHIMSMDTITCSAARLSYDSQITHSGDYGSSRESTLGAGLAGSGFILQSNVAKWNKILDIQRDGLILGTEDRHMLVFELRATRCRLECHWRLPATPDMIICERRAPSSFDLKADLRQLTYKILVSCRNCRVYSIDQYYICNDIKSNAELVKPRELLSLQCNVIDMCWCEWDDQHKSPEPTDGKSRPNFLVATLNRKVYCFNSHSGECKWLVETETPITCLIGLPKLKLSQQQDTCLVGVASQSNRIDFHLGSTGRVVDSIYFSGDYCQAMTFGRFGREDNCLCLVLKSGGLMIFILKRTAKFAHGQCLSSAASFAHDTLTNSLALHGNSTVSGTAPNHAEYGSDQGKRLRLNEPAELPSAFNLARASAPNVDSARNSSGSHLIDHNCDQQQIAAGNRDSFLQSQLEAAQAKLQIPSKNRDFVDQVVEQSRNSTGE